MNDLSQFLKNGFFARHETFCPRYGWLKKGFDRVFGYNEIKGESSIFDAEDAIENLGVGKKNSDLPAFSTRMHDLSKRFLALETLVAAQDSRLPDSKEKEARLIHMARPDGSMEEDIFWISNNRKNELNKVIKNLSDQYQDEETLKGLFVLLGEHLLKKK